MNEKQEIRAKALELAILMLGPDPKNDLTPQKFDAIPERLFEQAKTIEQYILQA
jgi:hypothetical protein